MKKSRTSRLVSSKLADAKRETGPGDKPMAPADAGVRALSIGCVGASADEQASEEIPGPKRPPAPTQLLSVQTERHLESRYYPAAMVELSDRVQIENRLRESEARFRNLADAAPVLIWLSGTDKKCTYFNKRWLEFTGRALEQELGHGWVEGVHPEDRRRWLETYFAAFDARKEFSIEYRLRRHDGQFRWMLAVGALRPEPSGKFLGFIGSCTDITERKAVEARLRASEDRFRTLASHAPVGIFMTAPDGRALYVNESWCAMAGLKAEKALGSQWLAAVHPEDRARIASGWQQAVEHGDASAEEFRFLRGDGSVVWVQGNASKLREPGGAPAGYVGTVVDITLRKQAEEALRESRDRLKKRVRARTAELVEADKALRQSEARVQAILEHSPSLVFQKDLHGRYALVSRGFEKAFHLAFHQALGKTDAEIFSPRQAQMFRANDLKVLESGLPMQFDQVAPLEDGPHTFIVVKFPLRDSKGKICALGGIATDITERRRLEEEIVRVGERERQRIAQDLHDGLGQQLVGVHCLSDALTQNLAEQKSPEARTAARITKLLEISVAQTRGLAHGLYPVAQEPEGLMTALQELAANIASVFRVSCRFVCRRPVLIADCVVATHLYRIAQEAVTNALKHARARRITIGLSSTPRQTLLAVSNDGSPFKEASPQRKGLGLRIMNYRAKSIDGTLMFQRPAGGGTKVLCRVPRADVSTSSSGL